MKHSDLLFAVSFDTLTVTSTKSNRPITASIPPNVTHSLRHADGLVSSLISTRRDWFSVVQRDSIRKWSAHVPYLAVVEGCWFNQFTEKKANRQGKGRDVLLFKRTRDWLWNFKKNWVGQMWTIVAEKLWTTLNYSLSVVSFQTRMKRPDLLARFLLKSILIWCPNRNFYKPWPITASIPRNITIIHIFFACSKQKYVVVSPLISTTGSICSAGWFRGRCSKIVRPYPIFVNLNEFQKSMRFRVVQSFTIEEMAWLWRNMKQNMKVSPATVADVNFCAIWLTGPVQVHGVNSAK